MKALPQYSQTYPRLRDVFYIWTLNATKPEIAILQQPSFMLAEANRETRSVWQCAHHLCLGRDLLTLRMGWGNRLVGL